LRDYFRPPPPPFVLSRPRARTTKEPTFHAFFFTLPASRRLTTTATTRALATFLQKTFIPPAKPFKRNTKSNPSSVWGESVRRRCRCLGAAADPKTADAAQTVVYLFSSFLSKEGTPTWLAELEHNKERQAIMQIFVKAGASLRVCARGRREGRATAARETDEELQQGSGQGTLCARARRGPLRRQRMSRAVDLAAQYERDRVGWRAPPS
jgi:hypothetical protein